MDLLTVERSGSWVEFRTLDFENPGSNAAVLKPWASFSLYIAPVHSAV